MPLWIVGTDTDVGKTCLSAALLWRFSRPNRKLNYWKPCASGVLESPRDVETVQALTEGAPEVAFMPETYALPEPLSPHLAARLAGVRVERSVLLGAHARACAHAAATDGGLVIEGVGGVCVPLTEHDRRPLLIDLLDDVAATCVVVARSTLGTINHTLLTVEALRARDIDVLGVILNGPPNPENARAIRKFGHIRTLGNFPQLEVLTPESVAMAAREIDPEGVLESAIFTFRETL